MAKKTPRKQSEHVARARNIIRKKEPMPPGQECLDLVKQLKQEKAFGYARKLLGLARDHPASEQATQEQAQRLLNEMGLEPPQSDPRPLESVVAEILAELAPPGPGATATRCPA